MPGTYSYANRYCSIFHQGLADEEAADAKNMLRRLRRFISLDQFTFLTQGDHGTNPYNSIVQLFYNQKSKSERATLNQEISKLEFANVLFDSAIQLYHGTEFIDDLAEAIADQRMVRLALKDGIKKAELNQFEYCPYVLKQYNNRWYCFGYSPHDNWKSYHELAPASSSSFTTFLRSNSCRKVTLKNSGNPIPNSSHFIQSPKSTIGIPRSSVKFLA